MKKADWYYEYAESSAEWKKGNAEIKNIEDDLKKISRTENGVIIATQLWNNQVPFFTISKPEFIIECEQLNNLYTKQNFFSETPLELALQVLKKSHQNKIVLNDVTDNPVVKYDLLTNKNNIAMTEKELSFIENQFKRIGVKEAFTDKLIEQMKTGVQNIEHPFDKMYDGNEAKALFYLKKSDSSDLYFLNKYDLGIRKDDQTNEVKQTFYLNDFRKSNNKEEWNPNRFNTTFTFKEAVNYSLGYPVLKTFKNQSGEEYHARVKANFKNKLSNGNYEMNQYHLKNGFDLEKVLSNFSIKELANATYKERLIESLQRGNLQSVTFVGAEGKQEKLFISPNIPLKSLNVYDLDKQRIPTQTLVDKSYIGKEIAEEFKQRIEGLKQKNGQSQKQEDSPKNEQKEKLDQTKDEKEGEKVNKENKHKQTNKQKVSADKEKPKHRQRQKNALIP